MLHSVSVIAFSRGYQLIRLLGLFMSYTMTGTVTQLIKVCALYFVWGYMTD